MVTVFLADDSPLTEPESITLPLDRADASLRAMGGTITRLKETATPDHETGIGCYVLEVHYSSILVGSRLLLVTE